MLGAEIGALVKVTWVDSGLALHGWQHKEDMLSKARQPLVETVGYYLGEGEDDMILVAQTRDTEHDDYLNTQAIWMPSVRAAIRLDAEE